MTGGTQEAAQPAVVLERALSQAVRTPLHSLMGFLELLAMTGLDDDQRRLHDRLVDSAEELLAGSDRVLWLLRLADDTYRPRPARVHLATFAAEVAAAGDGVVSTVVAADAPQHVDTDLAVLHQLLQELLGNARLHGVSPVVLAISPRSDRRPGVRITVSDGGAGLAPEARRALVETVSGARPPSGVGLALVGRLAELIGGEVSVLPSHVGTQIALVLPATTDAGRSAAPALVPPPAGPTAPARALRILLVEDNATNRLLTERQLARLGHTLTSVATGGAGVAAVLDGAPVDVVLMDRHLPDIDGCEATRRIRAGLPDGRAHLPVIAVTADATADADDACRAAGMDEVLTKPVDIEQLRRALERAAAAIGAPADAAAPSPVSPAERRGELSLDAIARWFDGDVAAARELVDAYLAELPGRRLRIQASLRRDDPRAVVAAADSLRTSSDAVGASTVAGICAALGAAAAGGDLATARAFLPSLAARCEHLLGELRSAVGIP